jgi:regulator of replication initiation timing
MSPTHETTHNETAVNPTTALETTPNQIATNKLTITNRTETVESTQDSFLEIKNYIKILIEENKTTRSEMQQLRMELQQIHNQIEQLQVQLNV